MFQFFKSQLILCVNFVTFTVIYCSVKGVRNSALLLSSVLDLLCFCSVQGKDRIHGYFGPMGQNLSYLVFG